MIVSVIIPTYNREEPLLITLKSLLKQDYPDREIILVDQTPQHEPQTLKFLKQHQDYIQIIKLKKPNTSLAKNLGVEKARGEIILFVDDDIKADTNLLTKHVKNYSEPKVGGVAGRVFSQDWTKGADVKPVGEVLPNGEIILNFFSNLKQEVDVVMGGNASWRKEVFEKAGGFDPNFIGNAMREEADLSLRVKRLGYKIVFEPRAIIYHFEHPTGGTRQKDRREWYFDFFHNEFLFFLKNLDKRSLWRFFWRVKRPILACMVWYGKLRPAWLLTPWRAFARAWRLVV